ncbi:MAG: YebC/PmpR family DNA-binding transcriptional regulator [Mollicutes bacterium PWAP]|nr:YebC/PmpR family DNA-binding transcriptional regulator [Mollicutes bacterium PWAP]
MAGHSKWHNIQHRKGAQDAKRSKEFAKLSKEIMVAAVNGDEIESNASLRAAIAKARAKSMPKKNIESAIKKGSGNSDISNFKEYSYGANVNGVSLLIKCLSDNANRVAAQIQFYVNKQNGQVSSTSSVSYIFDFKGLLELSSEGLDEDDIIMKSLEAGAEDFVSKDGIFSITTEPSKFMNIKDNLEKEGFTEWKTAEVTYIPNIFSTLSKEKIEKFFNFLDKIEDDDDVQEVFHNLNPEIAF